MIRDRRPAAVLLLAACAALAACDSATAGHGTPADSITVSGGSVTVSGGAPPTSTPTPEPPPQATDGENVAACNDAKCQILVRPGTAIPVPTSTQVTNLKVTAVTADRITLTGRTIGNFSQGICSGQCDSSSVNGAFTVTMGESSEADENKLAITVDHIADGTAILTLAPFSS